MTMVNVYRGNAQEGACKPQEHQGAGAALNETDAQKHRTDRIRKLRNA